MVLFWVLQIPITLRCSYLGSACTEWPLPNDKREKANVLKLTHSNLQSHPTVISVVLKLKCLVVRWMEWCNTLKSDRFIYIENIFMIPMLWISITSNEDVEASLHWLAEIPKESSNRQGEQKTTSKGPISLESGCLFVQLKIFWGKWKIRTIIWSIVRHNVNRRKFAENMKIALLGGTGETGVEVILDKNKNKKGDVGAHVSNSKNIFRWWNKHCNRVTRLPLGWGVVVDLGSFPFPCLLIFNDDLQFFNHESIKGWYEYVWHNKIFRRNRHRWRNSSTSQFQNCQLVKVRNPERVEPQRNLTVSKSDVFSVQVVFKTWLLKYIAEDLIKHLQSLEELFQGQDAVVSTLGFPKTGDGEVSEKK